jgi:hypothetical protein
MERSILIYAGVFLVILVVVVEVLIARLTAQRESFDRNESASPLAKSIRARSRELRSDRGVAMTTFKKSWERR